MFDFYERRKIKQWVYSWPTVIFLVVIAGFLLNGVWGVYLKERQTRINKQQRSVYLDGLEVRKDALGGEINRLNTERGVEEEIRKKYEVAKEGEKIIVIIEPPSSDTEYNIRESKSWFDRFLRSVMFWR